MKGYEGRVRVCDFCIAVTRDSSIAADDGKVPCNASAAHMHARALPDVIDAVLQSNLVIAVGSPSSQEEVSKRKPDLSSPKKVGGGSLDEVKRTEHDEALSNDFGTDAKGDSDNKNSSA